MREIPVDTERVQIISTGNVRAVDEWVVKNDGGRERSGNQAREELSDGSKGRYLWYVEAIVPVDGRTEVASVTVPGDQPDTGAFGDVLAFDQLMIRCWVDRSNRLGQGWNAEGVRVDSGKGHGGRKAGHHGGHEGEQAA